MSKKALEMATQMANWIDEKKGKEIQIFDIKELSTIADCFVIAHGSSTPQVKAIADFIEEKAKEEGYPLLRKEGYQQGTWVLLDYNSVILHIFHEEERDFYKLERLWQDAKKVEYISEDN
jgi:ribosome-associated protein